MSEPDFVSPFLAAHTNTLHSLLASPHPLGKWVFVVTGDRDALVLPTEEATPDEPDFPAEHRSAVAMELAKPRRDDELLLFDVRGGGLAVARLDRARMERDLGPPFLLDARNHFPMPWPTGWRGPYALDLRDTYRIDTPDCQVLARIVEAWDYEDLDAEMSPKHLWQLEIGVTRALDPALADDDQIAAITTRFRRCGPWRDVTERHQRRHPSRRIFVAEVEAHQEGTTPWREIQPPEVMLGPPPGWEPVGSFHERPLVFRIEGTKLTVEWTPPPGSNFFEAATGRLSEASRFTLRTPTRKPTDEEVGTVFAMLGGATFREVKGVRAPAKAGRKKRKEATSGGNGRVFLASAGWLRKPAGRG